MGDGKDKENQAPPPVPELASRSTHSLEAKEGSDGKQEGCEAPLIVYICRLKNLNENFEPKRKRQGDHTDSRVDESMLDRFKFVCFLKSLPALCGLPFSSYTSPGYHISNRGFVKCSLFLIDRLNHFPLSCWICQTLFRMIKSNIL